MPRLVVLLLVATFCVVLVPASARGATGAVVIAPELKGAPSATAETLDMLPRGRGVPFLYRKGDWLRVKAGEDRFGWARISRGKELAPGSLAMTDGLMGSMIQTNGRLGLRSRSHRKGKLIARIGTGECLLVRGVSQSKAWLLVEAGDQRTGWIPRGDTTPVLDGRVTSNRVGPGCEVAPRQRVALRARATRRSRKTGDARTGELLWVEETSPSGAWVLVDGSSGNRGWVRSRRLNIRAESKLRDKGFTGTRRGSFEAGMAVSPLVARTPRHVHPDDPRKGSRVSPGDQLYVMDLVVNGEKTWLLTESNDGRWGWLPAAGVRAAEQGVAIVDDVGGIAFADRVPEADTLTPAPDAKSLRFSGDLTTIYSVPTEGFSTLEMDRPRLSIAVRGIATKSAGNWNVGALARFAFGRQAQPNEPTGQSQTYDARLFASYPGRITPYINVGYALSTASTQEQGGTYAVDATSGPLATIGLSLRISDNFSLSSQLQGRHPFRISDGVAAYSNLLDNENSFNARFGFFGLFVRANITRAGDTTTNRYSAGMRLSF